MNYPITNGQALQAGDVVTFDLGPCVPGDFAPEGAQAQALDGRRVTVLGVAIEPEAGAPWQQGYYDIALGAQAMHAVAGVHLSMPRRPALGVAREAIAEAGASEFEALLRAMAGALDPARASGDPAEWAAPVRALLAQAVEMVAARRGE